ncbi:hypothetical protein J4E85_011602 [Alternaria conjuncta]|uniref:uncharacterized protein n=1 Tax=Alternaria conjuncta TaxID=181017 RepID=UPI0022205AF8|nr:uncharacterized protein J4E85_011602 [Alternaria conjuncta]KAI4909131.1 hypothetical protein J4E85_011602 [Alternaria conjuncta]
MVGATRGRTRKEAVKRPVSPSDDGTIADAPLEGTAIVDAQSNPHMPSSVTHPARDDVSRLSEGLEPLHLIGQDDSTHPINTPASREIDPLTIHVKEAIATIGRLEALGLQRYDIPLPKCIVLGEQSTGKSSVIEAISGIKTPRADDTCTRCPLLIKLDSSDDPRAGWSATVTLRRNFGYDGKPAGPSHERRFPGWIQLPLPNDAFFADTDNPENLEHIIRRAQLATISPRIDYHEFLLPSLAALGEHHKCKFSPNIVCISITQPGSPSLSFYDLPGLINQADIEEEAYLIQFVRDVVVDYVKDAESLILVTCSLATDIANSTAAGIARSLKATDRCIGVLTKPDCLPKGSRHDKLMEVFDQKRFALGHGYFVVKNPAQDELNKGLTHQEARLQEHHFFSGEDPWSTTFKDYAHRFGTLNLQSFLSGKLADQITKKLPVIEHEIDTRLAEVEARLQQFPEPPNHNASRIISDIVLDFSQGVRKELEAEFPCKEWRNKWRLLQNAFFDALVSMKPTMATGGRRDASVYADVLDSQPGSSANKAISLDDDDDEYDDGEHSDDSESAARNNPETPTKKRKIDGMPGLSPVKTPKRGLLKPLEEQPMITDFRGLKKKFVLDEVTDYLSEHSQSKVPGQIEPRVVDNLMLSTLEHWDQPLAKFFDAFEKQIKDQMKVLFTQHFKKWQGSTFHQTAWKIVEEMLATNFDQQRTTMANESLNDEKEGPYIFHNDIFECEKEAVLENYQQARFKYRFTKYKNSRAQRTGKPMSPAEEERLKKDVRAMEVFNHEPYLVERGVVAQVTTYYMLAVRRFHDAVCMRIESKFYKQLRTQLRDELENGLGLNEGHEGYENAKRLLSESSHRFNQRMELVGQRDSLLQGQKILRDLQQRRYGGDSSSSTLDVGSRTRRSSASGGIPTPLSADMEDVDMAGVPRH